MQHNIRKTRILKEQGLVQNKAQWITQSGADIIKFEMMEGFGYIYLSPIYPFTQPKFRFEPNRQYFYFIYNYHDYQDYDHFIEQKWSPQLNAGNLVDNFKTHIEKNVLQKKQNSLDILSDLCDKIYKYGGQNLYYLLLIFITIFMHSVYNIKEQNQQQKTFSSHKLQIFQSSLVDKINDICDMYGQPYVGILQMSLQLIANNLIVTKYFRKYYESIQSGVLLYLVLNNSYQFQLNQFLIILFIVIENVYMKTIIISFLVCLFDLGDNSIFISFYSVYVLASLAFRNFSSFRATYYKFIAKLGDVLLQGTIQLFIGVSIAFFIKFINAYLEDPDGKFDTLERSFEQWFDIDLFWDHNFLTLLQLIPCCILIIVKPQLFPIGFSCLASTQGGAMEIIPFVILSNKYAILNLESISLIYSNNETFYFNFFVGFLYSRSIKFSGWMKSKVHYNLLQKGLQCLSIICLFARFLEIDFLIFYSQILVFICYFIVYNVDIYQKIVKYSRKQKQD